MNVLVIASRFPWPPYSGDRLRTTIWLEALAPHARVTLVAPSSAEGFEPPTRRVAFFTAERSLLSGLTALGTIFREGLPLQTLLAAPYRWQDAIAEARRARGPFDVTIVVLSRVEPWVRASLPEGRRILDAIDSLASNMRERGREASLLTRWIWSAEEKRTAAAERSIPNAYERILFVSEEEARAAGPRGVAVSNGVALHPLESHARRFDFGFWGRLAYFANADAARWLVDEIWPAIRATLPAATLAIAGAHAPSWLRRAAERCPGVTFLPSVADMPALGRDVRVVILPLRYGSGESTKMLEAAEAGCAVVATSRGARSLTPLAAHTVFAEDASSIAREAVALLRDDERRTALAAELRSTVAARYARQITLDRLAALVMRRAA